MNGGKNRQPLGYTIVEVMIVLAVSGVMFLIAATFISGKQQRTAFTQGVNEMASRIQDVIEQVTDGSYSDIPLQCSIGASSLSFAGGLGTQQGTNTPCTFIGKVIYFAANQTPNYYVFTVAGARVDAGGNPITDLKKAMLTPVSPPYISASSDMTDQQTVPQSLDVTHLPQLSGGGSTTAIGFLQSLGTSAGGALQSGAQTISLDAFNLGPAGATQTTAAQNIFAAGDDPAGTYSITSAENVFICVTDETHYAKIFIGANNGQLNVSVQQNGTTAC